MSSRIKVITVANWSRPRECARQSSRFSLVAHSSLHSEAKPSDASISLISAMNFYLFFCWNVSQLQLSENERTNKRLAYANPAHAIQNFTFPRRVHWMENSAILSCKHRPASYSHRACAISFNESSTSSLPIDRDDVIARVHLDQWCKRNFSLQTFFCLADAHHPFDRV